MALKCLQVSLYNSSSMSPFIFLLERICFYIYLYVSILSLRSISLSIVVNVRECNSSVMKRIILLLMSRGKIINNSKYYLKKIDMIKYYNEIVMIWKTVFMRANIENKTTTICLSLFDRHGCPHQPLSFDAFWVHNFLFKCLIWFVSFFLSKFNV